MSILHIPQTIPLFRSNYILSSIDFFDLPAKGKYTIAEVGGGGGQRGKPKLKEERRNERHKSSENAQEN